MHASRGPGLRVGPAVVTVVLGVVIALQSRVNGQLSALTGTGLFPAWWTMLTGLLVLVCIVVLHRASRQGIVTVIAELRAGRLPWLTLTGGVFGGLFLLTQAITVPLVGVAVFSVGVVAGQTFGSLLVDRLGISASGIAHITVNRVIASILAVLAVFVAISNRLETTSGALAYAALAFLAGAVIAPQQAANGRIAVAARSPFAAALVNFAGGVVMLSVILAAALSLWQLSVHDPWGAPLWTYAGGLLGLSIIAGAAWVVPALGVLVFSLLSVLGQLSGALVLDLVAPTEGTSVGWQLFAGVAMTALAIFVGAAPWRSRHVA